LVIRASDAQSEQEKFSQQDTIVLVLTCSSLVCNALQPALDKCEILPKLLLFGSREIPTPGYPVEDLAFLVGARAHGDVGDDETARPNMRECVALENPTPAFWNRLL